MGVMTAAVPQHPASLKLKISSTSMGRRSGLSPMSSANRTRDMLVMDGSIEVDFGVMYRLSAVMAKKLAGPDSSIYRFSFASR